MQNAYSVVTFPLEGIPAHVFGMFLLLALDEVSAKYCMIDVIATHMVNLLSCWLIIGIFSSISVGGIKRSVPMEVLISSMMG